MKSHALHWNSECSAPLRERYWALRKDVCIAWCIWFWQHTVNRVISKLKMKSFCHYLHRVHALVRRAAHSLCADPSSKSRRLLTGRCLPCGCVTWSQDQLSKHKCTHVQTHACRALMIQRGGREGEVSARMQTPAHVLSHSRRQKEINVAGSFMLLNFLHSTWSFSNQLLNINLHLQNKCNVSHGGKVMLMNDAWGYVNERHPVASWSCWFEIHIPHPSPSLPPSPLSSPLFCFWGGGHVRMYGPAERVLVLPTRRHPSLQQGNWHGKLVAVHRNLKLPVQCKWVSSRHL